MAKRRRGASEEDILLLVLFLFGAMAVVGAMVVSVGAGVLEVATEPAPTATPTPADIETSPTITPSPPATDTPSPATPTITPTPSLTIPPPTPADTTPPGQVAELVAGPGGGSGEVQLTWDANLEPDVAKYNVYRSVTKGGPYDTVVASVENDQVAWLPTGIRGFIDFPVLGASWYVVSAEDLAGNEGMMSNEACGAPVGDSCFVVD